MITPFTIHRKRTHHRSKGAVLIGEDFSALSEILSKEYPDARYYMEPTWKQTNYLYPHGNEPLRTYPPRLLIHRSLYRIWQSAHHWNTDLTMVLDTQWLPTWKRIQISDWHPCWSLNSPPKPFVSFRQLGRFYPSEGKLTAGLGTISVHCTPGNNAHLKFASRFFRLFGKIASDRNLASVDIATGEIKETYIDKTAWNWVGHAARRWASEDSSRLLYHLRPVPVTESKT